MTLRRALGRRQVDSALNTAPFNDRVNRIREQLCYYFNISAWPPNREFLDDLVGTQSEVYSLVIRRKIAASGMNLGDLGHRRCLKADSRSDCISIALRSDEFEQNAMISILGFVDE